MAYSEQLWQEAKRKCRLNVEDLALAKRLGINPKSLMKNVPNKSEPWKAPVKDWLHEIEAKRNKKSEQKQKRKEKANRVVSNAKPEESTISQEEQNDTANQV